MRVKPPYNLSLVTRTVYTIYWDETMAVQDAFWQSRPHGLFNETSTRKQMDMHEPFLASWPVWSGIPIKKRHFQFGYPLQGATEFLFATIKPPFRLHVFKGDYEGYRQAAQANGVEIVEHERRTEAPPKHSFDDTGRFVDVYFVSHPSSIDGEIWDGLETWLENMALKYPHVRIYLDLAYVGSTKKRVVIEPHRFRNIEGICFSFSKPFGTFFHRIGGAYLRHHHPVLHYNKWFKNLPALALGDELMRRYAVNAIPERNTALQAQALVAAQEAGEVPADAVCSDVVLLARGPTGHQEFERAPGQFRFCLTKGMDLARFSP